MSQVIKNRSEILFIYDITDTNPNGDPADENKPRIDEETGFNIVTDVRLKRTVRDYLHDFRNEEIFVRGERKDDGSLKTKEDIFEEYKKPEEILEKCIDIRLFGGTFALKGKKKTKTEEEGRTAFAYTGPVQFRFGRSLHKVGEPTYVKGTTVMPSAAEKKQGTFVDYYILPYSLIAFYGIVNQNAAKETGLADADIELLLDGLWNGTKNLISRSKVGQMPRFLLQVVYKEGNFHIGELDHRIRLVPGKADEELRKVTDLKLDITDLRQALGDYKAKISKLRYCHDPKLELVADGKSAKPAKLMSGVGIEELKFSDA